MINKKLLSFDRKALRYVGLNVLFQCCLLYTSRCV